MPTLKEVIDTFTKGFQYLDGSNRRKGRWYEFWYHNETIRKELMDEELTMVIEQLVNKCNKELAVLGSNHGEERFAAHQDTFFKIITDVFHKVQIQRFVYGTVSTENYQLLNQHIFERNLVPKQAGFFEECLIRGIRLIANEFSELTGLIKPLLVKIKSAELKPILLFHESSKRNSTGKMFYSGSNSTDMQSNYYQLDVRERYANTHINKIAM